MVMLKFTDSKRILKNQWEITFAYSTSALAPLSQRPIFGAFRSYFILLFWAFFSRPPEPLFSRPRGAGRSRAAKAAEVGKEDLARENQERWCYRRGMLISKLYPQKNRVEESIYL